MIFFLRNVLLFLISMSVALLPQLFFWKRVYGTFFLYVCEVPLLFFDFPIYLILFSSRHGLFSWTPLTAVGVLGLFFLFKKEKNTVIALILCFFVQIYIYGTYLASLLKNNFGLGHAFGMRWLINCTPIFIIGLAALLNWLLAKNAKSRIYIISALAIFFILNSLFIIQYKLGLIPPDNYLSFREMVIDKFTIPFKAAEYIKFKLR